MGEFRVAVVVSGDRSDLYFANELMKRLNVVGVIVENQRHPRDSTSPIIKALKLVPQPHILLAKMSEMLAGKVRERFAPYSNPKNKADFGEGGKELTPPSGCKILYTKGVNDINDPENVAWLRNLRPEVVAVCGASIFKEEILRVPSKGVLNLHGGLSQQYRGLFTTDWAVYNEQPEYIGATVHFVSPGIDDGDIVYQGRPRQIEADDNPNSLYVKVVRLGVDMMERAIRDIEQGKMCSTALSEKGALYLGSKFTSKMRDATWRKVRRGIVAEYLQHKEARDMPVLARMINNFEEANDSD